jgi:hypothetical protein
MKNENPQFCIYLLQEDSGRLKEAVVPDAKLE